MAQYKSSKKGPIKIDVVLWPLYPQGDILRLQTLDGPNKFQKWPKKIGATTWSLHMLHIQTLERSTLGFKLGKLHSLTEGQILRSFQIFSSVWKGGS